MRVQSHRQWLVRCTLPAIATTFVVLIWGVAASIIFHCLIADSVLVGGDGNLPPQAALLLIGFYFGAPAWFAHCLITLICFARRAALPSKGLMVALVWIGTPIAFAAGSAVWRSDLHRYELGYLVDAHAPALIGVLVAWAICGPLERRLRRMRIPSRRSSVKTQPATGSG